MFSFKSKRPSSARRNIKQETYSPFVSSSRLRSIQELLHSSDACGPDAILCVLGIDSRYNDGTGELINYLLFGFFDSRKEELEKSGFAEETIDDMMFLIRRNSIDIYCNPVNYNYLLPYVAHWRNLHIHCLSEEQYQDEEKAEEFKIRSFLAMVSGCRSVAIPYCSSGQQLEFDMMAVEKWPIVQAYAIEGIGGGGFFTMKYHVTDISPKLHKVYQCMDPVALETLVTEQLPLFERQWQNMVSICDAERSEKTNQLTEGRVCEPLSSFFSHGRVVTAKGGRSLATRHPFVLFGNHTSRSNLQDAYRSGISFNSDPRSTGIQGNNAHHMVCQAVSPRGPLSCTRTYFFDTAVAPIPMSGSAVNLRNRSSKMTDARLVQEIYKALVKAVQAGIYTYSITLSKTKAENEAKVSFEKECITAAVPLNPDLLSNRKCVEFHLSGFDNQNRCMEVAEGQASPYVKTLGMTMYDIPSIEITGQVLGSVSFSESFIHSNINVLYPDEHEELNGDSLILTSCIPHFITWPLHTDSESNIENIEQSLTIEEHPKFGQKLLSGEGVHLISEGQPDVLLKSGEAHLYEHGLVFIHPHLGVVVLPKQEISAMHFYDGDSPSVVTLLILSYKEHVQQFLPVQLHNDTYRLILSFQPKTRAYKTFFTNVLPLWRTETEKPPLEMLGEVMPPELHHIHSQLQEEFEISQLPLSVVSAMKQAKCKLPNLSSFLEHYTVSSVGESPVSSKHMSAVLQRPYDEGSFDDNEEIIVTILAGIAGSHKEHLCAVLTKLAKEDSRWVTMKQPMENIDGFNPTIIQASLKTAWQNRKRKPGLSVKKQRALVVTPGFADTIDVIQAVLTHPEPEVARHIKIGAVTVCIDPSNAFMRDLYTLPKILDQCSQGWVNNIIFTGTNIDKGNELAKIQQLVRAVNSDVSLLLAPGGEVTRSTDIDFIMSETAFSEESLVRARYLSCPGWWQGRYDSGDIYPPMEEVILPFSQPLEKSRLISRLKALKNSHSPFPFTGNVFHIRSKLRFQDCSQLYELRYVVLSGSMTLNPAELIPMPPSARSNGVRSDCCMVFVGCALNPEKLREWMRSCAKQKPDLKVHRTRGSLTRVEINRVHKEHHLDHLPDGWFYNGSQFVSLEGDRSDTHPDLDMFLNHYLERINNDVDQHNARVAQLDYHDLFE